jgi:hypothetical protein
MQDVVRTLDEFGHLGVQALRQDVAKVSATGETADSIYYEVKASFERIKLTIWGRKFFSTLETGRGPRKGSEYQEFDEHMLKYMKARGIGADLTDKKRKQLARFLTYKINKEGDKTFKQGGRIVYSPTLRKLVDELKKALREDLRHYAISEIRKTLKAA